MTDKHASSPQSPPPLDATQPYPMASAGSRTESEERLAFIAPTEAVAKLDDGRPTMMLDDPTLDHELPRPPLRWKRWVFVLGLLACTAGLIAAAPLFFARPPLSAWVVRMVLPKINGEIAVGALDAGWTTPVIVHDLAIRDADGVQVFAAKQVTLEKTFVELWWNTPHVGRVIVADPVVTTRVAEGKSTLTSVFHDWINPPAGKKKKKIELLTIEIPKGRAELVVAWPPGEPPQTFEVEDIEVKLGIAPKSSETVPWKLAAKLKQGEYHFAAEGRFEPADRSWHVDDLDLTSPVAPWALALVGQFKPEDEADLALAGNVKYDLPTLAELVRKRVGPDFILEGNGQTDFKVAGRLASLADKPPQPGDLSFLKLLAADARFSWLRAEVMGFQMGETEAVLSLEDGAVRLHTPDLPVNEGHVHIDVRVVLTEGKPYVTMPPGVLVDRVHITPAMCKKGLAFIAPILAEATEVRGETSIDITHCHLPLERPASGEFAGVFKIHTLEVGAGSMVKELARLLKVPASVRLVDQSEIHFELKNERVYHEGMEFGIGPFHVRTSGTVGIDESLDLVAELLIPDDYLGDGRLASLFKGRTIKIPIGGTLKKPKVDLKTLSQANLGDLAGQAQGMLEGILQGGLPEGVVGQQPEKIVEGLILGDENTPGLFDIMRGAIEKRRERQAPAGGEAPAEGEAKSTAPTPAEPEPQDRPGLFGGRFKRFIDRATGREADPPPSDPKAPAGDKPASPGSGTAPGGSPAPASPGSGAPASTPEGEETTAAPVVEPPPEFPPT